MKRIIQSFQDFLYPPICLHCRSALPPNCHHLCAECISKMELIDPKERCPFCFSADYHITLKICPSCKKRDPVLHGLAAAFDYVGPAGTLIRRLKYSDQPYLARGAGAYLAAQFLALQWPFPDLIVPIPIAFTHLLERGYNQSLLLAESLSEILKIPIQESLTRKSGDFSQAGLDLKQRMKLTAESFHLKKGMSLQDKNLLLIDDVMTTGSTLRRCAEVLQERCPSAIYGLTVCRAIK